MQKDKIVDFLKGYEFSLPWPRSTLGRGILERLPLITIETGNELGWKKQWRETDTRFGWFQWILSKPQFNALLEGFLEVNLLPGSLCVLCVGYVLPLFAWLH
jgi:hypothetical protein